MKPKKSNSLLRILAGLVGGIFGYAVVSGMYEAGRNESATNFFLTSMASEMNKKLPMSIDSETRLELVEAGPGKTFTYVYSLVNKSKGELDVAAFRQNMRLKIVEGYKTSSDMKSFRDRNIELHYKYKDRSGELVSEFDISPKDF